MRPLLCLFCASVGVLAQSSPQTFRTAIRLVEVHAVVTDKRGNPVSGLTRDDFTITEDRVRQTITFFEVIDRRSAGPAADAATAPRGAFSNAANDARGTTAVILLDRLNAAFDSQWFARRHADPFLQQMQPHDRVALYVLEGGIRVLHDWQSATPWKTAA